MTERHIYKANERHEYDPGSCPKCGSTNVDVDWLNVGTRGNPDEWLPGLKSCANAGCPGRPQAGDIFS